MKTNKLFLVFAATVVTLSGYVLAVFFPGCFGFDQLKYFPQPLATASPVLFLGLAAAAVFFPAGNLFAKKHLWPVSAVLIAGWLAALVLLRASAPLLGDGMDRISSLAEPLLKTARTQPAPLDIFLHWAAYRLLAPFAADAGHLAYSLNSYLAGLLYLAAVIFLARKVLSGPAARFFFAAVMLAAGFVQLFAGYAENYCFIPAGLVFWMAGVKGSETGKFSVPAAAQITLILLHFFFLLLLPVTVWVLWRNAGRKSLPLLSCLAAFGFMVSITALFMVRHSYRGPAIFLDPARIFSLPHLADFLNLQILACPALLLLLLALAFARGKPPAAILEKALLGASVIFLAFFFILRPVLGAVRDWDLFSIPAMIYTAFLLIYALNRLEREPGILNALAAAAVLVSIFHTGSWLLLNHSEEKMVSRIASHLEARQSRERWASGYGFLVMADYFEQQGRVPESDSAFRKAGQINPGYSVIHQNYGLFLWKHGRRENAIQEMELAARLNPTNQRIKMILAGFRAQYQAGQE